MRERVDLKSPVREYRPPGSVRGAAVSGSSLPAPSSCSPRPSFLTPLVFALRFPLSGFSFQPFSLSAFCFIFHPQPVEQRALGLRLPGSDCSRAEQNGVEQQVSAFSLLTRATSG